MGAGGGARSASASGGSGVDIARAADEEPAAGVATGDEATGGAAAAVSDEAEPGFGNGEAAAVVAAAAGEFVIIGLGMTAAVPGVTGTVDATFAPPGWNRRMNATISFGSVLASANLSFMGSMSCPFPSSIECCNSASLRVSCHLGSVKSGMTGIAFRTIPPFPSTSWHAMQIAR